MNTNKLLLLLFILNFFISCSQNKENHIPIQDNTTNMKNDKDINILKFTVFIPGQENNVQLL